MSRPNPADRRPRPEPKPVAPARRVALEMLQRGLDSRSGSPMDRVLEEARRRGELTTRDAALTQEIAFGVCRQRRWLETVLARYLHHALPRQAEDVNICLLIGLYQAIFLEKIPAHTIVDETVKLVRLVRTEAGYRSLTNAIMRRVTSEPLEALRPPADLSWPIRESVPDWLASEAGQVYRGDELARFFEASNHPAPLALRIVRRPGAPPAEELEERLRSEVADLTGQMPDVQPGRFLKDCLLVQGRRLAPEHLQSFRRGYLTAEDEGAQLVCHLAGVGPGMRILDLCASPGGKCSHLADITAREHALLVATDVSDEKLGRLRQTLERLDLAQDAEVRNVASLKPAEKFDVVLVDAPCSGLGTLRRHPEIRWRSNVAGVRALARQQQELLAQAISHTAPGGHVLYSVCTFTRSETDQVVDRILESHAGRVEPADAPAEFPGDAAAFQAAPGRWRTAPHLHGTDAFFAARLRVIDGPPA